MARAAHRHGGVEPEARLPGALLEHEEPTGVVGRVLTGAAARLPDGEVEAEEVDVRLDLGIERLQRKGAGLTERVWTFLLGLTVRP